MVLQKQLARVLCVCVFFFFFNPYKFLTPSPTEPRPASSNRVAANTLRRLPCISPVRDMVRGIYLMGGGLCYLVSARAAWGLFDVFLELYFITLKQGAFSQNLTKIVQSQHLLSSCQTAFIMVNKNHAGQTQFWVLFVVYPSQFLVWHSALTVNISIKQNKNPSPSPHVQLAAENKPVSPPTEPRPVSSNYVAANTLRRLPSISPVRDMVRGICIYSMLCYWVFS